MKKEFNVTLKSLQVTVEVDENGNYDMNDLIEEVSSILVGEGFQVQSVEE